MVTEPLKKHHYVIVTFDNEFLFRYWFYQFSSPFLHENSFPLSLQLNVDVLAGKRNCATASKSM